MLGGDASCATGGFWSALTIATTQQLPLLFYVEDNGYGISVPSDYQTPGKDIAANLASFTGLTILSGDGTDPAEAAKLVDQAVGRVRKERAPVLLRLTVPRLEGHSAQDTQAYKAEEEIAAEWKRDPLPKLKKQCSSLQIGDEAWASLERETAWQVQAAVAEAEARGVSAPEEVTSNVFFEGERQQVGGLWNSGYQAPPSIDEPKAVGQRINMVTAIRRVLDQELEANPRVLAFGEDVGPERRRPCGDARAPGEVRSRAGVRHVAERGGNRWSGGRNGARGLDAGAGNPIPQICRTCN